VDSGGPVHTLSWLHRCYEALVMDGPRPPARSPAAGVPGMAAGLTHWSVENDLGAAMLEYALHAGDHSTLRRALGHLRRAWMIAPRAAYAQVIVLTNLGLALCGTFHHTGRDADLDDAIGMLRAALAAALDTSDLGGEGASARPAPGLASTLMRLLARALHLRFELAGRQSDLYEAGLVLASATHLRGDPDARSTNVRHGTDDDWQPVLVREDHAGPPRGHVP